MIQRLTVYSLLVTLACLPAVAERGAKIPGSESPDGLLVLRIAGAEEQIQSIYLSLDGNDESVIALPLGRIAKEWDPSAVAWSVTWSDDGSAVAVGIGNRTASEVYAFVPGLDEKWLGADK